MVTLSTSRTGEPTACVKGRYLHSPFDPRREASRFVRQSLLGTQPGYVVLLGAGLGYIVRAVAEEAPGARIVCLYYSEELHRLAKAEIGWHPGRSLSSLSFLKRHIRELDLDGIRVLEWNPSAEGFPQVAREVRASLRQFLRELRGSQVTTGILGRRWIRNTFLNFVNLGAFRTGELATDGKSIVIFASGPSGINAAPLLSEKRGDVTLWALPSAVPFLSAKGLMPDLVVMTDPGFYATCHLYPMAGEGVPIALPLSAALGSWRITEEIHLLSQPNFFEKEVIAAASLEAYPVPSLGTVAATALDLALRHTKREIIFCGLDLCFADIRTHVRPNLFDTLLRTTSCRLSPHYAASYGHALNQGGNPQGQKQAPERRSPERRPPERRPPDRRIAGPRPSFPLETYAGWFSSLPPAKVRRVFRLYPSEVDLKGIREMKPSTFRELAPDNGNEKARAAARHLFREAREETAKTILAAWLAEVDSICSEIRRTGSVETLMANERTMNLLYFVDLPGLLSMSRALRAGRRPWRDALSHLETAVGFLATLRNKISQPRSTKGRRERDR
jgi:hypothetical protein